MRPDLITLLRIAILVFVTGAILVLALDSTIRGTVAVTTMSVVAYICASILVWIILSSNKEKALLALAPAVAMSITAGAWVILVVLDVSAMIFRSDDLTTVDQRRWIYTLVETLLMCPPLAFIAMIAPWSPKRNDGDNKD